MDGTHPSTNPERPRVRPAACALLTASTVGLGLLLPALASAQDGDGDGVPNVRDICPRTRAGRSVDSAGCDAFCEVVYDAANGSSFLRSRLVEVGAADYGSFGTATPPPAGWHPRGGSNPSFFGFVADPVDTDWTDYDGDFFVPGTPEEGFGMNVGGVDYYASRLMGERGIVGNFTGVASDCRPRICGLRGGASTYWSGSVAGIDVDQIYSVFNEGVFILVEVTLTNTTGSPQTVYYMRNVDPDNMVSVTGSYDTANTIVAQGDGSPTSLALVSATTTAPDSYIALGSSDPDARVTFGGFSNRDVDGAWNCASGYTCALGAAQTSDIAISIAFRKNLLPGESQSFSFVYAMGASSVAESVSCTVPSECGDGLVEGTESCDDRNLLAGDGCDASCGVEDGWTCMGSPSRCSEICGDALVVGREACDTAGASATCDADCTAADCGDATLNPLAGEACDDGNLVGGDGCSPRCAPEECGNAVTDVGEDCDDGGESPSCDADCTRAACGDGTWNVMAGEACDEGAATPTCDADCSEVVCGDGLVNDLAGEVCDDGNLAAGDGCSALCTLESCGNGVVEDAEDCDDAGESPTCDANCTAAVCGDGVLNTMAGESCDDGNPDGGDGCSPSCEPEPDAGMPDAGPSDAGPPDAGTEDASSPDAGEDDAGRPRYGVAGGAVCSVAGAASRRGGYAPIAALLGMLAIVALRRRGGL